ncbi:6-phosphogluconolactonase [Secundilactobacillus pentosiphilus]|uniref:6-phosphogluconolactonase n=1 Tax=Secundilactobacillus pentosiphilus TaxID=1714682 RepID=A0A1Z5IXC4_9LACO|nr:lactonase family protein [Secundilactobacillus pentosiphilus]GAX06423.1 6-phosphogluconolactonase [Secundilactobacillus pentosiphilus]
MIDKFLLGGYTSDSYTKNNQSDGIYVAELDTDKKEITNISLLAQVENPAFFNPSTTGKKIATVLTRDDREGGVAMIDAVSGKTISESYLPQKHGSYEAYNAADNLYFWNELPYTVPSYVSIDTQHKILFAANYNTNAIHTYKMDDDFNITDTHTYPIEGHGPLVEQDHAHIHFARLLPDGRLIVCGLGCDKLFVYDVNHEDATLTPVFELKMHPGFGPRQIAMAHKSNYLYVLGELASRVAVIEYDPQTGKLAWVDDYSNIPEGYAGHNGSAAIRLSADEKYLYVSNRGHNSLAVHQVLDDGRRLEKIQQIKTEGVFPRDFSLSKNDDFLLCANQNSNELILFNRDKASGFLSVAQRHIKHDACVRVLEATDFLS